MGNFKIKSIWENKNKGGSVPADLEQRITQLENNTNSNTTNIGTNTTSITNLQTKVDTLFNRRVENSTINVGQQLQYHAQSGYEIVNLIVGRKRSRDGYYFFTAPTPLNFELFMHPNGQWTVYNNSTPNGFSNDFQIIILEKKV